MASTNFGSGRRAEGGVPNKWQSAGGGNGRGIAFSASRDFIALSFWLIVPIMRSEMRESPLEWFMHFQIIIINPESAVSNGSANYNNNKPRENNYKNKQE